MQKKAHKSDGVVEQGGIVNFDSDSNVKADGIESAVKPAANTVDNNGVPDTATIKILDAYVQLMKNVPLYMNTTIKNKYDLEKLFEPFKSVFASKKYASRGFTSTQGLGNLIINSLILRPKKSMGQPSLFPQCNFPIEYIKDFLEQDKFYGADLEKSGLYELSGLDKFRGTDAIGIQGIMQTKEIFAEFNELQPIYDFCLSQLAVMDHPYISLLAMPIDDRNFFAGATVATLGNSQLQNSLTAELKFPLTTLQIYNYAKSIGEVAKSKDYVERYKWLKQDINSKLQ